MDNANSSEHSKEDDGNKDMEEFNEEEWKKAKPALSLEELTTAKKREGITVYDGTNKIEVVNDTIPPPPAPDAKKVTFASIPPPVNGELDTSTPAADEEKLDATTAKSQEKFENIEEEKIETTTPATAAAPEKKVDATKPPPGSAWWDGTGENDTESHEQETTCTDQQPIEDQSHMAEKDESIPTLVTASPPSEPETSECRLNEDECNKCIKHGLNLGCRVLVVGLTHPLAFGRTLMQLGHEPYPITRGRAWFIGPERNYLPNILKYVGNIYHSHGLLTIYTGIGAHIAETVTDSLGSFALSLYMDHFLPELGGAEDLLELEEAKADKPDYPEDAPQYYPALRLKMREAIRKSVAGIAGIAIARPFAVIMIRQIAQHIGNEGKYEPHTLLQPLLRIGNEEGPPGFFSGIIPSAISILVTVWGTAAFSYGADCAFKYLAKDMNMNEEKREQFSAIRKVTDMMISLIGVGGVRYPFDVVSTVMAVTGSGLLVSVLPYSPLFHHWADAYDYLNPYELHRGAKVFWREEKSSIRIGANHQTYSSKKHFI